MRAFSLKLVPVSSGSSRPMSPADMASIRNGANNSRISASLPELCVAITTRPVSGRRRMDGVSCSSFICRPASESHHRHFLQIDELGYALPRQREERGELLFGKRNFFGGGLQLDNIAGPR